MLKREFLLCFLYSYSRLYKKGLFDVVFADSASHAPRSIKEETISTSTYKLIYCFCSIDMRE
jgi:hypothetical protein